MCSRTIHILTLMHTGGYYLRKSWVYFRTTEQLLNKQVEQDKRIVGLALFGIGIFHFIVSLIPPQFLWLAKLLGFEGQRDKAIQELENCSTTKSMKCVYPSL